MKPIEDILSVFVAAVFSGGGRPDCCGNVITKEALDQACRNYKKSIADAIRKEGYLHESEISKCGSCSGIGQRFGGNGYYECGACHGAGWVRKNG